GASGRTPSANSAADGASMEPCGCNRWQRSQIQRLQEPQKHAKTVAMRCDQLPEAAHGKEGVSGSSPEEGSAKDLHRGCCTKALSGVFYRFDGWSRGSG